jgi:hypothetical protein
VDALAFSGYIITQYGIAGLTGEFQLVRSEAVEPSCHVDSEGKVRMKKSVTRRTLFLILILLFRPIIGNPFRQPSAHTGFAFHPSTGVDYSRTGVGQDRPNAGANPYVDNLNSLADPTLPARKIPAFIRKLVLLSNRAKLRQFRERSGPRGKIASRILRSNKVMIECPDNSAATVGERSRSLA